MYKKAQAHFKKADPKLHRASLRFDVPDLVPSEDIFRDIVWTIIGQQLSGKAADTIFDRFASLFPDKKLDARSILKLEDTVMRSVGLSGSKARAIRTFSEHVLSGDLVLENLKKIDEVSVITELTKVKGIGPWTAEMILMFSLGRTDVFSAGDLGLMKGLKELYGLRQLPDKKKVERLSQNWSPYRTYAARILWRIADEKKNRIPKKRLSKK